MLRARGKGESHRHWVELLFLNKRGKDRFRAFSAASHPTGKVNPGARDLLERLQIPTEGLRSKHWDELSLPGAPALDFVPDPAHVEGAGERADAFREALRLLSRRINLFTGLPVESLDRMALTAQVRNIGEVTE
jgi:arsenate reductase